MLQGVVAPRRCQDDDRRVARSQNILACKAWRDLKPLRKSLKLPAWEGLQWASRNWGEAEAIHIYLNLLSETWIGSDFLQITLGEEGLPALRWLCLSSPPIKEMVRLERLQRCWPTWDSFTPEDDFGSDVEDEMPELPLQMASIRRFQSLLEACSGLQCLL